MGGYGVPLDGASTGGIFQGNNPPVSQSPQQQTNVLDVLTSINGYLKRLADRLAPVPQNIPFTGYGLAAGMSANFTMPGNGIPINGIIATTYVGVDGVGSIYVYLSSTIGGAPDFIFTGNGSQFIPLPSWKGNNIIVYNASLSAVDFKLLLINY